MKLLFVPLLLALMVPPQESRTGHAPDGPNGGREPAARSPAAPLMFLPPTEAGDAPAAQDGDGVRISNFVFGSICRRDPDTGAVSAEIDVHANGEICEATKIPIRGRGRCVYAGEEKPCTWYGFEFDYENRDPDEPITCVWTRSVPADEATTREVVKRGIMSDTLELDLGTKTAGHYRHPMYQVYTPVSFPWFTADMQLTCTYRDEMIVETAWALIFSSAFQ